MNIPTLSMKSTQFSHWGEGLGAKDDARDGRYQWSWSGQIFKISTTRSETRASCCGLSSDVINCVRMRFVFLKRHDNNLQKTANSTRKKKTEIEAWLELNQEIIIQYLERSATYLPLLAYVLSKKVIPSFTSQHTANNNLWHISWTSSWSSIEATGPWKEQIHGNVFTSYSTKALNEPSAW